MLSKFYKNATIIPAIVALGINIVYINIDCIFSNYKSEWLTTGSFAPIIFIMALFNSAIIMVLALPIFLNKYPTIKNNWLLSMLSWFLLPIIWLTILLLKSSVDLLVYNGIDSPGIFPIINTVPYIIGLVLSYARFCSQY